ncbi:hypothetical protein PIROE2DRAFT_7281, partial [Piromyces sp. E2]
TSNKDALIDDNNEYFRFCKISGGQRHYSALLSKFIYQLIESERVYNETLDTALSACMHLSDIKNVGFEEFLERLTLLKNSCQEFLVSMQKKNDEKIFINYITSATFYKIFQDYVSNFNNDFIKIQKAKNENSRLQIQLKDIDLYLNAPFRRVFFYRAIYWNILRCKNQKSKLEDNKIIHSLNSLVNSILKCKEELQIENDDFMTIAKFEQELDSSKVNVNGESMTIFTYLCNGINTSPIENTPNIINTYNLEKITINNSDYEKSIKDIVTITIFSDFLIITKETQKSNKDNLKSQLLYPPIPLKEVSLIERKVPRHLQKFNHLDNGFDSLKLKNVDVNSLNYTDYLFELRCTNPQIFIVLQAENDEDRETFINSIIMQRNYILNDNHEITFDNLGQAVVSSAKPKIPQINIERDNSISNRGIKNGDNKKSISNMSIEVDNSIMEGNENNDVELGLTDKNDIISIEDSSKFNNTTIFQAICSPYYFKQNEWIKMPKSILCINQNTDGRNFITLNASATGRILLNEYICPDSVIKQSSKNDNVIQIKTKSRGLFSIRFSKYDTAAYNTLLNFSKDLIKDSIIWTYENKNELFLIEKSPSLNVTYDLVIKNNIDDTTNSFKLYCEKTTKYEIIDHLYIKEGNNWISLGLSKISIVIPNYIMENDIENSENPEEMELLSQNSIEPIISAHSLTDIKKPGSTQSSLMCFLRAPINQDCIILKNKNIHEDNVYELNFMFEENIYEYMIYSKKTDKSLAFVSEFINKLSNYYSKIEEEKYDPEFLANSDILVDGTEESVSEEQESPVEIEANKEKEEKEEEIKNDNEVNDDSSSSVSQTSNKNSENNLLAGFTFMTTSDKPPLANQTTQDSHTSQIKNQFVFDLGDFSSDDKSKETENTQNSTSIFSGFTLSASTKDNQNNTENEPNDTVTSPFFTNKPKFVVPTLNANSFGFTFNTTSNQNTTTTTTNSLFGNSTISPPTNPLFGNKTTTATNSNDNTLFNNKPGLFGNTTTIMPFGNIGNFGFNFSTGKNQIQAQNTVPVTKEETSINENTNREVTDVVEKKVEEEVTDVVEKKEEEEVTDVVEKKEEEEVTDVVEKKVEEEVTDVVEKKEEEEVTDVVEKKVEEKVPDVVEKKVEEEVADVVEKKVEEEVIDVVEKKVEEEVVDVVEKKVEEEITEVIEKKAEDVVDVIEDENKIIENVTDNDINDSNKKENEEINELISKEENSNNTTKTSGLTDEISEIKKQNTLNYNYPEVNASMSGTLFDVSEPYNEVKNEGKLSKLKNNTIFDDIIEMKSGKLSSFKYNQFVRSCNDLLIAANNIEIPIREFSVDMNSSSKDVTKDSIANLKFEVNKIRSIFNDSDASIVTYYDENSPKSNESLNSKTNIKKTRSITELEMKTIINDYIVKKPETDENKKLSVQKYIDKYTSSINNLNEKTNEEPKIIINTDKSDIKTNRVADIVSNINNNINNIQSQVIKKEEGRISQNYVDKMTKEFTMKGKIFKIYI